LHLFDFWEIVKQDEQPGPQGLWAKEDTGKGNQRQTNNWKKTMWAGTDSMEQEKHNTYYSEEIGGGRKGGKWGAKKNGALRRLWLDYIATRWYQVLVIENLWPKGS